MKIAVAGAGYVGLSNALILAKNNEVLLVDPDAEKVKLINGGESPIDDEGIRNFLQKGNFHLRATSNENVAYADASYVIVAVPTNYKEEIAKFDTSIVESVIEKVSRINKDAIIVIKSTVPVGFTKTISLKFNTSKVFFSPEFLREGRALFDCQHPSRIIIGALCDDREISHKIVDLLCESLDSRPPIQIMGATEAEAVKLFANTYLAMRVSYFNELDIYAEEKGLNAKDIIDGVCLDPRIGTHYNNPSFGYGGYCLPKDTKQLCVNYQGIPQNLISAIVDSNDTRKDYIVSKILQLKPRTVGIYRLIMKSQSDNFREASIMDIMRKLKLKGINIIIYEPILNGVSYCDYEVTDSLVALAEKSDVIVANRVTNELEPYKSKVYSRDLFGEN